MVPLMKSYKNVMAKEKNKLDKVMISKKLIWGILLFLLIILVVCLIRLSGPKKEIAIKKYYQGLNSHETDKVLDAYVPCLRRNEGYKIRVIAGIKPSQDQKLTYDYKIKSEKKMSKEDIKKEEEAFDLTCTDTKTKISSAYTLTVENTEKYPSGEKKKQEYKVKVGKVGGKWYILD